MLPLLPTLQGAAKRKKCLIVSFKKKNTHAKDEASRTKFSLEILEELDWCLSQLEHMQSHKTISDIASTKFKRMLNKELSHFAEQNKSDNQIAEYICNTYLGRLFYLVFFFLQAI